MYLHINPLVDPLLVYPCSFGLGLLLCGAAVHKLREPALFDTVLDGYQIFPAWLIPLFIWLVPMLELLTGLGLFFSETRHSAATMAVGLFSGYGALLLYSLVRGTPIADCGCSFGTASHQSGQLHTPLSSGLIWRNLVLTFISMNLLQNMVQRTLGWFDVTAIFLFSLTGAVFYSLANTLIITQQSTRNLES